MVVSVQSFYFDSPSSNPVDAYSFSATFAFEKNKNSKKVFPFFYKKNHSPLVIPICLTMKKTISERKFCYYKKSTVYDHDQFSGNLSKL